MVKSKYGFSNCNPDLKKNDSLSNWRDRSEVYSEVLEDVDCSNSHSPTHMLSDDSSEAKWRRKGNTSKHVYPTQSTPVKCVAKSSPPNRNLKLSTIVTMISSQFIQDNLHKTLNFLNDSRSSIMEFPELSPLEEMFLCKLTTNRTNLFHVSDAQMVYKSILDTLAQSKDRYSWCFEYRDTRSGRRFLIYRKNYKHGHHQNHTEPVLSPEEGQNMDRMVPMEQVVNLLKCHELIGLLEPEFLVQYLSITLQFLRADDETFLQFPELNPMQEKFLMNVVTYSSKNLLKNITLESRPLYRDILRELELNYDKYTFSVMYEHFNKSQRVVTFRKTFLDNSKVGQEKNNNSEGPEVTLKRQNSSIGSHSMDGTSNRYLSSDSINSSMSSVNMQLTKHERKVCNLATALPTKFKCSCMSKMVEFLQDEKRKVSEIAYSYDEEWSFMVSLVKYMTIKFLHYVGDDCKDLFLQLHHVLNNLDINLNVFRKFGGTSKDDTQKVVVLEKIPKKRRSKKSNEPLDSNAKNSSRAGSSRASRLKAKKIPPIKWKPANGKCPDEGPSPKGIRPPARSSRLSNRNSTLVKGLATPFDSEKASRMMQLMGWSGGALGKNEDGIKEPISININQVSGAGLGLAQPDIDQSASTSNEPKRAKSQREKKQKEPKDVLEIFKKNVTLKVLDFLKHTKKTELGIDTKTKKEETIVKTVVWKMNEGKSLDFISSEESSIALDLEKRFGFFLAVDRCSAPNRLTVYKDFGKEEHFNPDLSIRKVIEYDEDLFRSETPTKVKDKSKQNLADATYRMNILNGILDLAKKNENSTTLGFRYKRDKKFIQCIVQFVNGGLTPLWKGEERDVLLEIKRTGVFGLTVKYPNDGSHKLTIYKPNVGKKIEYPDSSDDDVIILENIDEVIVIDDSFSGDELQSNDQEKDNEPELEEVPNKDTQSITESYETSSMTLNELFSDIVIDSDTSTADDQEVKNEESLLQCHITEKCDISNEQIDGVESDIQLIAADENEKPSDDAGNLEIELDVGPSINCKEFDEVTENPIFDFDKEDSGCVVEDVAIDVLEPNNNKDVLEHLVSMESIDIPLLDTSEYLTEADNETLNNNTSSQLINEKTIEVASIILNTHPRASKRTSNEMGKCTSTQIKNPMKKCKLQQEKLSALEMAIVSKHYPTQRLTPADVEIIQSKILDLIDNIPAGQFLPFLKCNGLFDGALRFQCANSKTANWLKFVFRDCEIGNDFVIKVIECDSECVVKKKSVKMEFSIKDVATKDPMKLLQRMKLFNPWLDLEMWFIVDHTYSDDGQRITLLVDPESATAIEEVNCSIYAGVDKGTFTIVDDSDSRNPKDICNFVSPKSLISLCMEVQSNLIAKTKLLSLNT